MGAFGFTSQLPLFLIDGRQNNELGAFTAKMKGASEREAGVIFEDKVLKM